MRVAQGLGRPVVGHQDMQNTHHGAAPANSKADESFIAGHSQILGDGLEFINRCAGQRALRIDDVVQAVIQVVVDKGLLGLAHRALGGMELLGHIQA
jgi:hypothetical protein